MNIGKVIEFIKAHQRFLISSHTNMEGDALGSELSFAFLLKALGKVPIIVNEDNIPYGYDFLPGVNKILKYSPKMPGLKFDCFVTLDCSDQQRTGEVYRLNSCGKPVLNIDHHVSNSYFGTVNWVDTKACCACELVWRLFKKMRVPVSKDAAVVLYAGIITDTGSFRYSCTNGETHRIAAELVDAGVNVPLVYRNIYGNIPYEDLKLLSDILPTMQRSGDGRVVWFEIHRDRLRKQKKIFFDLSESILNFARSLKGVEVVVLFKENISAEDEVRLNFRSQGRIDVNKIAQMFGGGGHKAASGATIKGSLVSIKRRVLAKVKAAFDESD